MNACVKCDGDCLRSCFGNYAINSLSDAHDIRLCDVIQGNLVINLGTNIVTPRQLEQAFGRVRVVMGHMVVRFSSTFTTLEVFKNLREIGGQIGNQPLYRDRYALAVFENQNLRNAFKPLSIKNGSIMFHNNRVLCYKRILEFQQKSDISAEITEIDVSKVSNGEKAICECHKKA
ncbi:hypothetical protein L596_009262 [Steinernema carpocapsae]|uniref:Receptor L-domain domain-containing protein n=1 Tax=Steinernema carpocapsae TaxID=34508 RepID=A0A4U5PEU2_STECR|nr:hypothetical protein L596_009262 [Steinernema carpocapsae]